MKRIIRLIVFLIFCLQWGITCAQKQPVDYVNLFTGTSDYSIMNVTGFSHIHAGTMAGLMVMPATFVRRSCHPY